MPGTVLTAVISAPGGGTVTVNDDIAVTALNLLNTNLSLLNARIGTPVMPGSLAAASAVQAASLNEISTLLATVVDQQKAMVESLSILQFALTGISTNIGQGVTTSQLAYIDQVKNNQFQQATTNDALERADLPPTEVPDSTLNDTVLKTSNDIKTFQVQSQVASITTTGITYVQEGVVSGGTWLISKGWTLAGGPVLVKKVKAFFKITDPQLKEKAVQANATARAKLLGIPQVEVPPDAE